MFFLTRRKETRFFALVRARGRAEGEQAFVFRRDGTIQCPKKRRGPILRPTLFLLVTTSCLADQHHYRRNKHLDKRGGEIQAEPKNEVHAFLRRTQLC